MYAYCGNNPVNRVDYTGETTVSLGVGASLYLIGGLSYSIDFVFDDDYNIGIQVSEANIFKKGGGGVQWWISVLG